jgi:hypothetical protein
MSLLASESFPLMPWLRMIRTSILLTLLLVVSGNLRAQSSAESVYRKLAPGVVTAIRPDIEEEETVSGPREMVDLVRGYPKLDWTPNFAPKTETLLAKASSTVFRREIWGLEFGFKPLRMIEVNGQSVIYLVYYVKNNGGHKNPTPTKDSQGRDVFTLESVDHPVRFFPAFVLESHEHSLAYLDVVLPEAMDRIRRREDPNRTFHHTVSISSHPIPVSTDEEDHSVWGIACWTGVDPRTDFFSIYIRGLTNAYRWEETAGTFQPGDTPGKGRSFSHKTLQLNFWRPGDAINPDESEFRYGLPTNAQIPRGKTEDELLKIYRLEARVDHLWVYR